MTPAFPPTPSPTASPSPPGHGNFLTDPVVYRGPYEYSVPGAAKDFTPSFEQEKP